MSKNTTKKVTKSATKSVKKSAKATTKKSTARKTFDIESIPQPLGNSVEAVSFRKYGYAMVGIFLRMLEYYQGVLFLTTNRVRDFDPAFNSRISIALHYPDLDQPVRLQIWKNLLECAGVDAQTLDLNTLSKYDINGRQIKNAIRIGMSLAAEDGRTLHQDDVLKTIKLGEAFNADLQGKLVTRPGTGFVDVYGV